MGYKYAMLKNGDAYCLPNFNYTPIKRYQVDLEDFFDTLEKMYNKGELLVSGNNMVTADRKCTVKNLGINSQGFIYWDTIIQGVSVRLYGHYGPEEYRVISEKPITINLMLCLIAKVKQQISSFYYWLDKKGSAYESYIEH